MHNCSQLFEDQVANAIQKATHLAGRRLRYEAADGNVVLHGTVGTYFQKQMAQEAIRRVDGVQHISNQLKVASDIAATSVPI